MLSMYISGEQPALQLVHAIAPRASRVVSFSPCQGVTLMRHLCSGGSVMQLAEITDQNMALRISCGELQQLLALQKAVTTERNTEILRMRAAGADRAELHDAWPGQQADCEDQPVAAFASAHAEARSSSPCQHAECPRQPLMAWPSASSSTVPQAMQRECDAILEDTSPLDDAKQLADREYAHSLLKSQQLANGKIAQLRAALAASERHRERQAALHKQQLEALVSRMEQVPCALMQPAVHSLMRADSALYMIGLRQQCCAVETA